MIPILAGLHGVVDHDFFDWVLEVLGGEGFIATLARRLARFDWSTGLVIREIWLLRLRAVLVRAHGDATAYADLRDRYRDMAKTLGYEGHIAWAEAMP